VEPSRLCRLTAGSMPPPQRRSGRAPAPASRGQDRTAAPTSSVRCAGGLRSRAEHLPRGQGLRHVAPPEMRQRRTQSDRSRQAGCLGRSGPTHSQGGSRRRTTNRPGSPPSTARIAGHPRGGIHRWWSQSLGPRRDSSPVGGGTMVVPGRQRPEPDRMLAPASQAGGRRPGQELGQTWMATGNTAGPTEP